MGHESQDFNTSYVVIKPDRLDSAGYSLAYFNTSYVVIKPDCKKI